MDTEMLMSLKVVARISTWVNVFNPGGLILIESLEAEYLFKSLFSSCLNLFGSGEISDLRVIRKFLIHGKSYTLTFLINGETPINGEDSKIFPKGREEKFFY